MTLQRYWTGQLGGNALEEAAGVPCRLLVTNWEALKSRYLGINKIAADGATIHTLIIDIDARGIFFTLTIEQMPAALYTAVFNLLNGNIPTRTSAPLEITDGIDTINLQIYPNIPDWFSRGEPSGAYVQNVVFNLVSLGG